MTTDLERADAALVRLGELHPKLIDLGLERGLSLLEKLGRPQLSLPPVLHAAGTNGKGSTLAFLRAMCEASGMQVHGYASPHLVRFHERIRIAGALITDRALADLLEEVERINADAPMTFFEITTAAAFHAFAQTPADVTLLETGLGGRADSTNVIPSPLATIITPIARDHEHFLGTTLTAIAGEKAGIMRRNIPCFSAAQDPEAEAKLISHAQEIGAPLFIAGRDFTVTRTESGVHIETPSRSITLPALGLKGIHQRDNAGLAAAVMMHAFPEITDQALIDGAARAVWPGRVQHLSHGLLADRCGDIPLWLDGAHNAHGAAALANSLDDLMTGQDHADHKKWVLVCGALNTRDPKDFLTPLSGHIAEAFSLTIPNQDAALSGEDIANAGRGIGMKTTAAPSLDDALLGAINAAKDIGGGIIIAGSLYLAGYVLEQNNTLPE